jgi:hypothetical protein
MSFWSRAFVALLGIVFLISTGPSAYRTVVSWVTLEEESKRDDEVTSPERARELAAKGQREQLISFREALREISAGPFDLYAIGVGQVTLKDPEDIPDATVTVQGSRQQSKDLTTTAPITVVSRSDCDTYPISGRFNNILLFDKRKDTFLTVFDKRVAISAFLPGCRTTRPVIWIRAVEKDTDGDGRLDWNDDEVFYVYALDNRSLHRVPLPHMRIEEVWTVPDVGYLLVKCRVDRNQDGEFDRGYGDEEEEPTTIMRIDLKTFATTPFVPAPVVSNLQRILEGRAQEGAPPP